MITTSSIGDTIRIGRDISVKLVSVDRGQAVLHIESSGKSIVCERPDGRYRVLLDSVATANAMNRFAEAQA